ncbi:MULTISPECIES: hypothetical protein [Deinococcus]|uniref:Uncharacterized protein n=1 Tax=Deinococcus carri TaxID=1211323 RepID=A0ABP9W721_9DEIO|nr:MULTISPECIES: hypothetical protein [Deinococcus]
MHIILAYQGPESDPSALDDAHAKAVEAGLQPFPIQEQAGRRQFTVYSEGAFPAAFKRWLTDYCLADWVHLVVEEGEGPRFYDDSAAITRL